MSKMSETAKFVKRSVTFKMYRGNSRKQESFECKSTINGRCDSKYGFIDSNNLIPAPADFLPFKTIENNKKNKPVTNYYIFKKTFILSLVFSVFLILSIILRNSNWLNPKQNENDTCKMLIMNNYLKNSIEWNEVYENIRKLEQQTEKIKNRLEEASYWRRKLKTKIEDLRAETLSILARKFEEMNVKIDDAFTLYDADKIGKTDYALESAGGSILSTPDTYPYPSNRYVNLLGVKVQSLSDPLNVIRPGTFPGQCFAFRGQKGRIRIQLVRPIIIDSITVDYPHPKLLIDTTSAPKDFKIYGIKLIPQVSKYELGHFTFTPYTNKTAVTFFINGSKNIFHEFVELKILSNHGHPNYTCIYRFRVHGKEKY